MHARGTIIAVSYSTHSSNDILQPVLLNKIYISEWTFKNNQVAIKCPVRHVTLVSSQTWPLYYVAQIARPHGTNNIDMNIRKHIHILNKHVHTF